MKALYDSLKFVVKIGFTEADKNIKVRHISSSILYKIVLDVNQVGDMTFFQNI